MIEQRFEFALSITDTLPSFNILPKIAFTFEYKTDIRPLTLL